MLFPARSTFKTFLPAISFINNKEKTISKKEYTERKTSQVMNIFIFNSGVVTFNKNCCSCASSFITTNGLKIYYIITSCHTQLAGLEKTKSLISCNICLLILLSSLDNVTFCRNWSVMREVEKERRRYFYESKYNKAYCPIINEVLEAHTLALTFFFLKSSSAGIRIGDILKTTAHNC